MKSFTLFLSTVALLLGGCQSPSATTPRFAPAPSPAINAGTVRVPETIRIYTLGAYVDADDPNVRHAAHEIHRIEQPARWQLASPPERRASPTPPPPLPTPAPTLTVLPPSPPILRPLSFEPVPPPDALTPPSPPAAPATLGLESPPPELEPALTPNADGLVDLTAPEASREPDDINPFAVRATATNPPREIKFVVSGLVGGPTPGAIINGVPLKIGETIESLILERVEAESVLLRGGERRVRLPVSTSPYRLRLAP